MTTKIFSVSKEQTNATRNIAQAIVIIKQMTQDMVQATSRQVSGSSDMRTSVDGVAVMVHDIFRDLESRKQESSMVVKELEVMRRISR